MKNIKYYLVIGLSAVFTACTDLLDIEPNNKITPNELFNNPNGAKAFMATIYRDLPIEDYMFMPGTRSSTRICGISFTIIRQGILVYYGMPISVRKLYKVSGGSSHRDTLFVRIILIMAMKRFVILIC